MRATVAAGNPARKYDIADHLFFKLQGATPGALSESVEVVKRIVRKHGGDRFWPAKTQGEAEAVWTDRKNGLYTGLAYAGEGAKAWTTDVWCVKTSTHNFSAPARVGFSIRKSHNTFARAAPSPLLVLTLKIFCSVPISKLPQLVYETQQDIESFGILYNVVGHAGDGKIVSVVKPWRGLT